MSARHLLPAAALLLTACAAAMPGYSPPPFKEKKGAKLLSQESGQMSEGSYELSESEKARDCKHTTGSIQIIIARLKDPRLRAEPSALSSGLQQSGANVLGGSTRGADRQAEYARERARLEAYNRLLAEKKCKTVDIEAELAKPPEAMGKKY